MLSYVNSAMLRFTAFPQHLLLSQNNVKATVSEELNIKIIGFARTETFFVSKVST